MTYRVLNGVLPIVVPMMLASVAHVAEGGSAFLEAFFWLFSGAFGLIVFPINAGGLMESDAAFMTACFMLRIASILPFVSETASLSPRRRLWASLNGLITISTLLVGGLIMVVSRW